MIRHDLFFALFGIGVGQAILLIATPFLARYYGPGPIGLYSVIVSVAGIIATISALRLDLALSSASDSDVPALTRAGLVLPFAIVPLATAVLAAALVSPIASQLPFTTRDLPMIALIALFQGLVFVGSALSTRWGAFRLLAAIKIVQPLVFAATALLALHNLPLAMAMAIGWAVAFAAAAPIFGRIAFFDGWRVTRVAIRQAWRFPVISTPMALFDVLSLALPLLVIASAFGAPAAGNYAQVQRVIGAPLVLLATAGGQTFLKHAGDRVRAGTSVMPIFRRFLVAMAGLASLMLLAVIVLGHAALQALVGPGWRTDTPFLVLALMPVLFRVVASPVSSILILTDRITMLAAWQVSYFLVTAATVTIAARYFSFDQLLGALAVSEFVMYAAYLLLSSHAARRVSAPKSVTLAAV